MTRLVRATLHTVMTWSLALSNAYIVRSLAARSSNARSRSRCWRQSCSTFRNSRLLVSCACSTPGQRWSISLGVGRPLERLGLGAELVLRHALRFQRPDPLVQGPVELVPARLGAGLESMGALLRPLGPDAGLLGPLLGVGQAPLAARGWRGAWPPRSSRR